MGPQAERLVCDLAGTGMATRCSAAGRETRMNPMAWMIEQQARTDWLPGRPEPAIETVMHVADKTWRSADEFARLTRRSKTLVAKVERAVRQYRRTRVVLGGGVACNLALQDALRLRLSARGAIVFAPSPRLATDNAAMIAAAGHFRFEAGERALASLTAHAALPIPGLVPA